MHARFLAIAATTAVLLLTPAVADAAWTGAGWYFCDDEAAIFGGGIDIISGPYADKDACMADARANHAQELNQGDDCDYLATNPNG